MRLIALTVAAVLIGSTASAQNYFSCFRHDSPEAGSTKIDLGLVRAEADGMVEIYDYSGGTKGEKLTEVEVQAGANENLMAHVMQPIQHDVMAELVVNGEVVASQVYDVCAPGEGTEHGEDG